MERSRVTRIVLLGAGNVATHLGEALNQLEGIEIVQLYSRTQAAAESLAHKLQTSWCTSLTEIDPTAHLYLFALTDSALANVVEQLPSNTGMWVHTAGSLPMELFHDKAQRYGVLYPLQTFSKAKAVDFASTPFFVEGSSPKELAQLQTLALRLSRTVTPASSHQRKHLHLAAVFACNFTNHLYAQAAAILEEQGLSFAHLLPLIEESVAKIHLLPPLQAQTGPAIRYDLNVMQSHLQLLSSSIQQEIYRLLSQSIQQLNPNK